MAPPPQASPARAGASASAAAAAEPLEGYATYLSDWKEREDIQRMFAVDPAVLVAHSGGTYDTLEVQGVWKISNPKRTKACVTHTILALSIALDFFVSSCLHFSPRQWRFFISFQVLHHFIIVVVVIVIITATATTTQSPSTTAPAHHHHYQRRINTHTYTTQCSTKLTEFTRTSSPHCAMKVRKGTRCCDARCGCSRVIERMRSHARRLCRCCGSGGWHQAV